MPASVPFSQIVYFGDSLTDTNEAFRLSELALDVPFPSEPFGYDGQFSDGPVYSDIVPELLGVGVENFAVGGARALGVIPAAFLLDTGLPEVDDTLFDFFGKDDLDQSVIDELTNFDINLDGQIGRYLTSLGGQPAAPGTVASIFIGLNDFNAFEPSETDFNMDSSVDALDTIAEFEVLAAGVLGATVAGAGTLLGAGAAQKVFINALPPGTFFPSLQFADPLLQAIADDAVADYNANLEFFAGLQFGEAVEIIRFDAIGAEIQKDPSAFGFLDITGFNLFVTGAGAVTEVDGEPQINIFENPAFADLDSDQYGFVDPIHFSTALHGVFGIFAAGQIGDTLTILSDEADDQTFSGANDLILAGDENDTIRSRNGNDTVLSGLGDDTVRTNDGDDIVIAGGGDDDVGGGAGNDILGGNGGNDILRGSLGNDILIDGLGSDLSIGGRGNDAFLYTEASLIGGVTGADNDVFRGGQDDDTLFLVLTDETRALVEDELEDEAFVQNLDSIGVTTVSIESFVFLETRADLAELELDGRLDEADLWGLV